MKVILPLLFLFLISPYLLMAHGSHGSGFMAGFTHPIFGLDHNLAILATGMFAYLLDSKKWFWYPLAFLAFMIIGGYLGIGQEVPTWIEKVIAGSVLVLGTSIGLSMKSGAIPALLLLAGFGFFHGFAHGCEMPADTTAFKYISGFSVGTIVMSFLGVAIAKFLSHKAVNPQFLKFLGGIIAGIGLYFLLG